jgi:GSH-dependent disulfide-bond oxidoreductase
MIDLYSAATMNGRRAAIALAECGLTHRIHLLDLQQGEHRRPAFLALNPSGVVPTIVDSDGPGNKPITVTQSGAIVLYCAEKSGKLIPTDPIRRGSAFEWFAQALTDVGPASSALFQMSLAPEQSEANVEFFARRFLKHCAHVDRRLEGRSFLADEFSIADVALYPIIAVRTALIEAIDGLSYLKSWQARVGMRPETTRAMLTHV